MAQTREYLIAEIRSRLPYMGIRELGLVSSFIRGLGCYGSSDAEWAREVLPLEKQRQLDSAYLYMALIVDEFKENPPTGIPAQEVSRLWHDSGKVRVKRSDLIQWMEDAGYITSRRKVTTEDGKRVEMLYISVEKFNQVRAAEDKAHELLNWSDKEAAAV